MPAKKQRRVTLALMLAYLPISFLYLSFSGQLGAADWRTASREPVGLAPDPATTPEAVVQVYSARAAGWRGWFGVHTWIAVKPANAREFTVHEVNGLAPEAHRHRAGGDAIARPTAAGTAIGRNCWPTSADRASRQSSGASRPR